MTTEITIEREVIIYIYEVDNALFPAEDLFPDEDLFPGVGTLTIDAEEKDCGIVSGSLMMEELIADTNIVFGQCISNRFECELFNIPFDISGKTIYVVAKENGTQIPIFKGIIDDSTTDVYEYNRKLVAYDEFYYKRDLNVAAWWNEYWTNREDSTLKELRDSLCSYVAIEYVNKELPNDTFKVKKSNDYTTITFTDVLKMICELQGCFPNIDRMGILDFVTLSTTEPVELTDRYEKNNASFKTYTTANITGVQIYADSSTLSQLVGRDDNPYSISGNIFLLNMTADEINKCCSILLNAIKNISYKPASIPMIVSDLDMLLGEKVSTESGIGYVLKNEYSGSLFVEEKITCAAVGEKLEKKASSANSEIIIGRKMSKLEQTIDGFKQEVSDSLEEVSSSISQTANSIELNVDNKKGKATISVSITDAVSGDTATKEATVNIDADTINLTAQQVIALMAGGTLQLSGEKGITISSPNFTVDEDGNVNIKGTIEIGSTIQTPNFTVDENGNVSIKGAIEAGSTIQTPNFTVDENGNVCIKGAIEAGSTIQTPNFTVDENGNISAVNGNFSGTITGSKGEFTKGFKVDIPISDAKYYLKIENGEIKMGFDADDGGACEISCGPAGMGMGTIAIKGARLNFNGNQVLTDADLDRLVQSNNYVTGLTIGEYTSKGPEYMVVQTTVGNFSIPWSEYSDKRLKTNIKKSDVNALDVVNQMKFVQFDWNGKLERKNGAHEALGLIADDLQEIIPNTVQQVKQADGNYLRSISNYPLLIHSLKAIQELSDKIMKLEKEIEQLKEVNNYGNGRMEKCI